MYIRMGLMIGVTVCSNVAAMDDDGNARGTKRARQEVPISRPDVDRGKSIFTAKDRAISQEVAFRLSYENMEQFDEQNHYIRVANDFMRKLCVVGEPIPDEIKKDVQTVVKYNRGLHYVWHKDELPRDDKKRKVNPSE